MDTQVRQTFRQNMESMLNFTFGFESGHPGRYGISHSAICVFAADGRLNAGNLTCSSLQELGGYMHIYIYIYTYIYIHMCMHVFIYTYICVYMYSCMCVFPKQLPALDASDHLAGVLGAQASQMPPRCITDASQMPLRFIPDASQMPLREPRSPR